MLDLIAFAAVFAFFAIFAGLVNLCDRIIGPDHPIAEHDAQLSAAAAPGGAADGDRDGARGSAS